MAVKQDGISPKVFLHKTEDISAFLQKLWEDAQSSFQCPIKSVLIKPNFVNDFPSDSGVTTSLSLIQSVISFLGTNGVTRICIAEAAMIDTDKVFENLNVRSLFGTDISIINTEHVQRMTIESPLKLDMKHVSLPSLISEFDAIINMPKLKTHCLTTVSLGLKNFFGYLSKGGRRFAHISNIDASIVDLFATLRSIKPIITIIDGTVALSGKSGPIHGTPLALGILIGGINPIAVDETAVRIMGHDIAHVNHLARAKEKLETYTSIEIHGESIADCAKKFIIPPQTIPIKDQIITLKNKVFLKRPVLKNPKKCTRCLSCTKVCPLQCIELKGKITIDYTKCISCLCCCESCQAHALDYTVRWGFIYTIARACAKIVKKILPL